jgi:hypothetical protein
MVKDTLFMFQLWFDVYEKMEGRILNETTDDVHFLRGDIHVVQLLIKVFHVRYLANVISAVLSSKINSQTHFQDTSCHQINNSDFSKKLNAKPSGRQDNQLK